MLIGEDNKEEKIEEIRKEIDILKKCRHVNVVSLYGCCLKDNYVWVGEKKTETPFRQFSHRMLFHKQILMDFCALGSVTDFRRVYKGTVEFDFFFLFHSTLPLSSPFVFTCSLQDPLTEDQIVAILGNVVKGLTYLHAQGIIHRDLKCANILLTLKGEVKIGKCFFVLPRVLYYSTSEASREALVLPYSFSADFGVSSQLGGSAAKSNTMIGTPLFMSPEVLSGNEYQPSVSGRSEWYLEILHQRSHSINYV